MNRAALYKALQSRDKRFDGRFYTGVKTTGIYCRPVCPARPLRKNVEFYRSRAEAEVAGFRPCLRCRPDLSPTAPLFHGTAAIVGRALKLLAEPAPSLEGMAARLGLTDRHLRRLFAEHVGASPIEVLTSRRLHLARMLLSQSNLSITEIAYSSGFRSLRRFNDAFQARYQKAPREFRKAGAGAKGDMLELELPILEPFDSAGLFGFHASHSIPGVAVVTDGTYVRQLKQGVLKVTCGKGCLHVSLEQVPLEEVRGVLERVRHLFDVDHNPAALPRTLRGVRIPGAFDGFETAVTIILGQLISVQGARAIASKLVARFGGFPNAGELATADLTGLGLTRGKAGAIAELAKLVAKGELSLCPGAPLAQTRARLAAIKGIGPWTVELIALRCLADTDAFPANDLVVARALQSSTLRPDGWKPWRGYLTLWLWKKSKRRTK